MTSTRNLAVAAGLGVFLFGIVVGQAAPPKGATGRCADGTYTTAKTKENGCTKHGGVKTWFGAAASEGATPTAGAAPAAAAASTKPATPGPAAGPSPATATPPAPRSPAPAVAPPPSEPGQVWVNTATKVYHCPGTRYYGATKAGKYMSEADAKAAGYRPDHGKACN